MVFYRFWFAFVLISTFINFIYCCFTLIPPASRERTIRNFLKQEKLQHLTEMPDTKNIIRRFTNSALCPGLYYFFLLPKNHRDYEK